MLNTGTRCATLIPSERNSECPCSEETTSSVSSSCISSRFSLSPTSRSSWSPPSPTRPSHRHREHAPHLLDEKGDAICAVDNVRWQQLVTDDAVNHRADVMLR